MNRIFFISDTHFFHGNIIKYCNRPYTSVDEMNSDLIKKWNNTVAQDDIVIHLGDVAFKNRDAAAAIVSQLNGHKRLIMGNHDNEKPQKYFEMGFEWVSPFPVIWQEKYILSHIPMKEVPEGYINIYGHIHIAPTFPTFTKDGICVCCERFNYTPIEFSTLIDEWKSTPKTIKLSEIERGEF